MMAVRFAFTSSIVDNFKRHVNLNYIAPL